MPHCLFMALFIHKHIYSLSFAFNKVLMILLYSNNKQQATLSCIQILKLLVLFASPLLSFFSFSSFCSISPKSLSPSSPSHHLPFHPNPLHCSLPLLLLYLIFFISSYYPQSGFPSLFLFYSLFFLLILLSFPLTDFHVSLIGLKITVQLRMPLFLVFCLSASSVWIIMISLFSARVEPSYPNTR